jgi:hypothetical protein
MVIPGQHSSATLEGLCEALGRKERGSARHSEGVAVFAIALAQAINLDTDEVRRIGSRCTSEKMARTGTVNRRISRTLPIWIRAS